LFPTSTEESITADCDRIRTAEFKEIRKEWKARKKEEENQRKAAEERERAAAAQAAQAQAQAQAGQVDGSAPADPSQAAPPPSYPGGVRPQLPPIGYQPADGQVPGQYGAPGAGNMVYPQGNGQMTYPGNYPHSPYGQSSQVYQQRK
jgi:transcription factor CON7